jgi:hypothetical protein
MSDLHAAELWARRSGGDPGRLAVVRTTEDLPQHSTSPLRYQTIALHEFRVVDADGIPVQHRTVHVIRALEVLQNYSHRYVNRQGVADTKLSHHSLLHRVRPVPTSAT